MTSVPTSSQVHQVFSLYRAQLREVRKLPHIYLQQFYRIKTKYDARKLLAPSGAPHLQTRLKSATRRLRRLQEANAGNHRQFERVLDLAYGRNGKLKWELLNPLVKDPSAPLPPRIIPHLEKSRPPAYSKPLTALLTNSPSMSTRPIRKDAWKPENLLPARADRTSEESHIFGPFSKRREYNMQWRYHSTERAKILPPLEITIGGSTTARKPDIAAALPLQGLGVFSDAEALVGTARPPPMTKKERKATVVPVEADASPRHPSLWVRRRYRSLLAKLPILTYSSRVGVEEGSYTVRLSDRAKQASAATNLTLREIDETNLAWLKQGAEPVQQKRKGGGKESLRITDKQREGVS